MKAKVVKKIKTLAGVTIEKNALVQVKRQPNGTYTVYVNGNALIYDVLPKNLKIIE